MLMDKTNNAISIFKSQPSLPILFRYTKRKRKYNEPINIPA
ncbi:hypothetical protein TERMP_00125 [Thermococcus barophilus MP]|uniref:Uncharacterized protein n=1 Tax=Thermococcus barophilus (strain DSM 11836 / MP) TaxID=391623 RepID=F0LHL9_THEBM|nr:hypothetical protein TERMP_00125 [Thermococcus barophilus MP]